MEPICKELPHGEFYLALPCRPMRSKAEVSYNHFEEDVLRPPPQYGELQDYEFDPAESDDGEPPPLVEESDDEEPVVRTPAKDSDSESEDEEPVKADERSFRASESPDLPHVKRWEGEPIPSVAVSDLWRSRAKAGNFKEVKIPLECYVGSVQSGVERSTLWLVWQTFTSRFPEERSLRSIGRHSLT